MVVNPNSVRKHREDIIATHAARVSHHIDVQLDIGRVVVSASLEQIDREYRDEVFNKLKTDYENVGWSVKRNTYSDYQGSWDNIEVRLK